MQVLDTSFRWPRAMFFGLLFTTLTACGGSGGISDNLPGQPGTQPPEAGDTGGGNTGGGNTGGGDTGGGDTGGGDTGGGDTGGGDTGGGDTGGGDTGGGDTGGGDTGGGDTGGGDTGGGDTGGGDGRPTPPEGNDAPELYKQTELGLSGPFFPADAQSGKLLVADGQGNTVLAWVTQERERFRVGYGYQNRYAETLRVSHYKAGEGWTEGQTIVSLPADESGHKFIYNPDLASTTDGHVVIFWGMGGLEQGLMATRYAPGGGWGDVKIIHENSSAGAKHKVAVAGGVAHFAWMEIIDDELHILSHHHLVSEELEAWGAAEPNTVSIGGSANNLELDLFADPNGNALIVWQQSGRTRESGENIETWASRYISYEGWGEPMRIDSGESSSFNLKLAGNAYGDAVVLWTQDQEDSTGIYARHYDVYTNSWGDAHEITRRNNLSMASIGLDDTGSAIATWVRSDAGKGNLYASHYTPGQSWSQPEALDNQGAQSNVSLAVDSYGSASVIWKRSSYYNADRVIKLRQYTPGSGWGEPSFLTRNNSVADGTGRVVSIKDDYGNLFWAFARDARMWGQRIAP